MRNFVEYFCVLIVEIRKFAKKETLPFWNTSTRDKSRTQHSEVSRFNFLAQRACNAMMDYYTASHDTMLLDNPKWGGGGGGEGQGYVPLGKCKFAEPLRHSSSIFELS